MAVFCYYEETFSKGDYHFFICPESVYFQPESILPHLFTTGRLTHIGHRSELRGVKYTTQMANLGLDDKPVRRDYSKLFKRMNQPLKAREADSEIWTIITIDCEKRRFNSQFKMLADFSDLVQERLGQRVHFINNGMTSSVCGDLLGSDYPQHDFERGFLGELQSRTSCSITDVWGESVANKLKVFRQADSAISAVGTAALMPNFCELPSVTFGNHFIVRSSVGLGSIGKRELMIPSNHVEECTTATDFTSKTFSRPEQLQSYDIPRPIYMVFLERLLEQIRK
jgi:hypothetical protein